MKKLLTLLAVGLMAVGTVHAKSAAKSLPTPTPVDTTKQKQIDDYWTALYCKIADLETEHATQSDLGVKLQASNDLLTKQNADINKAIEEVKAADAEKDKVISTQASTIETQKLTLVSKDEKIAKLTDKISHYASATHKIAGIIAGLTFLIIVSYLTLVPNILYRAGFALVGAGIVYATICEWFARIA